MFTIINAVADNAIGSVQFSCDLAACRGACCTMPGGRGAPVLDSEVEQIQQAIPAALPYLPPEHSRAIEALGAVEGEPGDYATTCLDERDCVFVYRQEGVAKCAIERAYFNGETNFRKPISCHLFPIRVEELFGATYLRYEKISECRPALLNGRKHGVPLYQFLEEALTRAFGPEFYAQLAEHLSSKEKDPKGKKG